MSKDGIQFIMASHSYFVVKKLANIARRHEIDIPVFSHQTEEEDDTSAPRWIIENMRYGLPDNPIMRESVAMYKEDLQRLF